MTTLIETIVAAFEGLWGAIITALASVGDLIFVVTEGTLGGLTPFGYVLAVGFGIPLATWLFNKAFSWIRGLFTARVGNRG